MKKFFEQKKSALISGMNSNKGFSLVELIIVVAIMAVLMGVLAPQYLRFVENSREQSDATTANSIVSAMTTALATTEGVTKGITVSWSATKDANDQYIVYNNGTSAVKVNGTNKSDHTDKADIFLYEVYATLGDVASPASNWATENAPTFTVGIQNGIPYVYCTTANGNDYKDNDTWATRLNIPNAEKT